MGSEQSSQSSRVKSVSVKEQRTTRSSSPGPSISSDSDIPYISYTVNQPIGDSPKLASRRSPARSSPQPARPKSYAGCHDIVVVKEGATQQETLDTDEDMLQLQKIPHFQPIMRGALNIPSAPDPDVLSKLDSRPINDLCYRYRDHLRLCSEIVTTEQNALAHRIREIDFAATTLANMLAERQKKFAKHCEQLAKVQEISANLARCHIGIGECISNMEHLNSMLPEEERLEPFLLVTG